jgi:hypothetical protein
MVEVKRNMRPELGVGELARRSGVSVAAIHFYERKGLIKSILATNFASSAPPYAAWP